MGDLRDHFNRSEFLCNHCNKAAPNGMDDNLLNTLEWLRQEIGIPIQVTSGYRCPYWNTAVGGVPNSYHKKGMAVDIRPLGMNYEKFYKKCLKRFGKGGVGHYPPSRHKVPFVHVDCGRRDRWEG